MPAAKHRYITPDSMKTEGNDTLDTFIRQAVGKEPFFSFSRAGDSPVQWIQLLQALDQQDLPGWPLLSPIKVQMQKCDKCSLEFCSTINYRRHVRMHRRRLNLDKDSTKNRDLLGQFWDKLTLEEVKEVVSFKDGQLEDVPSSTIVKSMASLIQTSVFHSLPQVYAKAGSALLDIIQSRPTSFPISSQELFNILDDASERTFLCAGTADSVQNYVFEGDAGKTGLEMKNIIACTCFMLEQKLVKAWVANKDAEALRCQKILVEEEEAAQRRQSELMERRRKKKLRQREHKAKAQTNVENPNSMESGSDILDDTPSAESSVSLDTSLSPSHTPLAEQDNTSSLLELISIPNMEEDADTDAQADFSMENLESGTYQHIEHGESQRNGHKRSVLGRWKVPKPQRGAPNGFHDDQNPGPSKHGSMTRNRTHRISRVVHVVNGRKVWTRKPKLDTNNENLNSIEHKESINEPLQVDQYELLIGSISVTLANCSSPQDEISLTGVRENGGAAHPVLTQNTVEDRLFKSDVSGNSVNRSTGKLWRPVSRHDSSGPTSDYIEPEVEIITREDNNPLDENGRPPPFSKDAHGFLFSSRAAKAFLAERWKEAMTADHVKLVLSPETENPSIQNGSQETPALLYPEQRSILGNAENRLTTVDSSGGGTVTNGKFKKSEKGVKLKYIPKQRRQP